MPPKPLIVLDTNVLVSGLRSRQGWSFQLLSRIGGSDFEHCISVPLVLEYEEVLKRMAVPLGLSLPEIDALLDYLVQTGRKPLVYFQVGPATADRDDQMVLELAIAVQADFLVTFNVRDFADAQRFGVAVCTPAEFCARIGVSP